MAGKRKTLNLFGPDRWYLIGLITSDGNLSKDGRHVSVVAKDYTFLRSLKHRLCLVNRIGIKNRRADNQAYQIQFSNVEFYNFLLSIGLYPNKSLTLDKLSVPKEYFKDFLRGLIDGDGSIRGWLHPTNYAEQWSLRIYSGSEAFLIWLREEIKEIFKVKGRIHKDATKKTIFVLKFGKIAARVILGGCYYQSAFGMERKTELAQMCVRSYRGWSKSEEVLVGENR